MEKQINEDRQRYEMPCYVKTWDLRLIAPLLSILLSFPHTGWAVPTQGHLIMEAGPSSYAVDVTREVSQRGGNVVDIAVAVALSMSVTHPYFASLGGGGFALVKMNGETSALDFRETAPSKASPELFKDQDSEASTNGGLAVAVPGIPAGLWALQHKYGKLRWTQLFDAAIAYAAKGFRVNGEWVNNTEHARTSFTEQGRRKFFGQDGKAYRPGDILVQPGIAKMLRSLRDLGPRGFYEGPVANDIVSAVKSENGIITLSDLKNYRVRWLKPLTTDFAGFKLYLMPPPSSGGIVIAEAVRLIEAASIKSLPEFSADEYHTLGEVMKLSYRGRMLLGDPDFAKIPTEQLLSETYLKSLSSQVKLDKTIDIEPLKDIHFDSPKEKPETTHFSVMDEKGNTVAMTVTLNGDYGSGVVSKVFGIALNNEMDDFTTHLGKPNMFGLIQGEANQVRAGARPLSSMSPTIVEKSGRTVLSLGSPGGPRIISAVLQVLFRKLVRNENIDFAIQAPRVHHQFDPNILYVDRNRFSPEVLASLKSRGQVIKEGSTAKVYGVELDDTGILSGAFDARGEGATGGI